MGMGKTLQMISLICANMPDGALTTAPAAAAAAPVRGSKRAKAPSLIRTSASKLPATAPLDNPVRTTLVVCPVVALRQWESEIRRYTTPGLLVVRAFYGDDRQFSIEEMRGVDVLLTTYSVVEVEYRRQEKGFKRAGSTLFSSSLLHAVQFFRIVLDESHYIKDRNSQTAHACFALESQRRWALSGTPLQNRIGELFSAIRFLQIVPYSYYYCKYCDCRALNWQFSGKSEGNHRSHRMRQCSDCPHSASAHFNWFNKHILNPIKFNRPVQHKVDKAHEILWKLLRNIMLRRTKKERDADLKLPPRTVVIRRDMLDEEENDFYEALYTQSRTRFMGYVESGTVLNNYAHIFDLLLRLRQAVDHPYLVLYSKPESGDQSLGVCGLCFEPAEDAIATKCKHIFCRLCIRTYLGNSLGGGQSPPCPTCRGPLTVDLDQAAINVNENEATHVKRNILSRIDLSRWRSSSKIEALMEELFMMTQDDVTAKAIVFSQFVNFLDLIEWKLKLQGVGCVKLDGRMSMKHRQENIEMFNFNPETKVFLISLKAGGVALNLTAASRCYLMDPWWNPAAEYQAMDRLHRLGQQKPIKITRFLIRDSIEERMLALQEKKLLLFQSTVGMDHDSLSKLTVEDLHYLFDH
eukprot:TRINITY_DN3800_c0_g1_i2.p1 TRINITY_DN3800_c0_g1~~TRINITY_DN3800_c0_g1_i2.p1  ORF type:complete len:635 (+),score=125.93 TRINITY_DN3800_c0_g1_i2:562-2466(+)